MNCNYTKAQMELRTQEAVEVEETKILVTLEV